MITVSNSSTTLTPVAAASTVRIAQAPRLISVDLLRGLVMVLMALDHTRDYFTGFSFEPEDLSHTYGALFVTRFVTHFCAPVFFLLAGTGSYLAVSRGKTVREISHFLWTRGLWLIFLEFTVLHFGWAFTFKFLEAQVIWVLGMSMIILAVLVHLPLRWIAAFGIVMIAGHNLLDGIKPDSLGKFSWLWTILHSPGMVYIPHSALSISVFYALVPWVGVMACGYAMGTLLLRPNHRKWTWGLGIAMTLAFFVLRGVNLYGNGTATYPFSVGPWHVQSSSTLTAISFFNVQKYPPSLDYILITLGPALIVLTWFDKLKAESLAGRVLLVFGRVPMFFYLLHTYLIHSLAILVALIVHQPVAWLWHGAFFLPLPAGYGHGLPFIYLMWITAVAILYFPCRWYMGFKARHRDWHWLSYV